MDRQREEKRDLESEQNLEQAFHFYVTPLPVTTHSVEVIFTMVATA